MAQIQGYRDAVTFLCTRPEVDPDRFGIFGTSFSGGHVLVVGVLDRRVKAVHFQVPVISGGHHHHQRGGGDPGDVVARLVREPGPRRRVARRPRAAPPGPVGRPSVPRPPAAPRS